MPLVVEGSPLDLHVHTELCEDPQPRKVLMSGCLMVRMVEEAGDRRATIEWGEPDAEGFYTPTLTVHEETP